MGDRGNIKIEGGECFPHPVWFYTHWRGYERKQILARALSKSRDRWADPSYLARVIFCELVNGDDGITGFGISTDPTDNSHPFLTVNMERKTVRDEPDEREGFEIFARDDADLQEISFEAFVQKHSQPVEA